MFTALASKLFGTSNERVVSSMRRTVDQINAFEPTISALTDDQLKAQTEKFRELLAGGKTLDDILPEAFATVREAAKRTLGLRHFDVQMMGGITMHQGKISEMRTGEGKTLVATLATYLNAIENKGVHVVTVNDYLARRDAEWMAPVYNFLGLSVGVIVANISDQQRRASYAADITYGTNNEFGFDYLRDNMKFRLEDMVQRPFNFAIVDEVDSILIDEARTPLIISGAARDAAEMYRAVDVVIPMLVEGDFETDEKQKSISLTDAGNIHVEELLRSRGLISEGHLYDVQNIVLVHHVNQALRAHKMFRRDVDYIVKDDQVIIIDEFTGRMMEGRRYSEGLHQALEAKERVSIQNENQVLATITFQNYFRLYPKLAGMTGTALTEAAEFETIYGLRVVDMPTNVPAVRVDHHDEIYRTTEEKFEAIVEQVKECSRREQPVLVGTTSIEKSETLSKHLKSLGIKHNVLNARYHEQEAHIIAQAGQLGAVTIATNMAGRGTDIKLGGNIEMRIESEIAIDAPAEERAAKIAQITAEVNAAQELVKQAGGLFVIGSERHESRRIDNQLRGRAGRQGDPGASKFFISLEDDLMRIFGGNVMDAFLQKMGLQRGQPIIHPMINSAIERAQKKVENQHFEVRKNLLKFDNVMNDQRKVIYDQRKDIMSANDVSETVSDMRLDTVDTVVARAIPQNSYPEQWDLETLKMDIHRLFGLQLPIDAWAKEEGVADSEILERINAEIDSRMKEKEERFTPPMMRAIEKNILLQILDSSWKEHLLNLEHLRHAIVLRAFGQKDPLNEYKAEAFTMFQDMVERVREGVTSALSLIEMRSDSPPPVIKEPEAPKNIVAQHGIDIEGEDDAKGSTVQNAAVDPANPATWVNSQRNAPCPCGSGKKYKHCHGKAL